MIVAIIAAEVAFWLLLLGGLALRYVVRARRASTIALAGVPLVDVVLVIFVTVDVARGAEPTPAHALAALYLGFTVAFGHSVIRWADVRFRRRFAGGPAPTKPTRGSRAEVRAIWAEWFRAVLAAAIAAAGLLAMIAVEGRPVPTGVDQAADHPYWAAVLLLGVIVAIWFAAGPAFAGRGRRDSDRQASGQPS